jgi:hypothetical protein
MPNNSDELLRDWLRHLDNGDDDPAAISAFAEASFLSSVPDPARAWDLLVEGIRRKNGLGARANRC